MDVPKTQYARSGDLQIAYQVTGEGPLDIVLVPSYLSNTEMLWELPSFARFYERLSSFARLILFDRRGSGMSDGVAGATPLEEQIDDVQAVIDASRFRAAGAGLDLEGCGLTALFAASHPDLVRALVLLSPQPRLVAGPGYEWAPSIEQRAAIVEAIVETWGTEATPLADAVARDDERQRALMARIERQAMSPAAAAATLAAIGDTDVRDVLPSVQCPTLVLRPEHDTYLDERHSLYVAEHIPNARYATVPGDGALWVGAEEAIADEIQHFLTGVRRPVVSDRVLATVLFTANSRSAGLLASPAHELLGSRVRQEVGALDRDARGFQEAADHVVVADGQDQLARAVVAPALADERERLVGQPHVAGDLVDGPADERSVRRQQLARIRRGRGLDLRGGQPDRAARAARAGGARSLPA